MTCCLYMPEANTILRSMRRCNVVLLQNACLIAQCSHILYIISLKDLNCLGPSMIWWKPQFVSEINHCLIFLPVCVVKGRIEHLGVVS